MIGRHMPRKPYGFSQGGMDMSLINAFTHRRVFSTFSPEEARRVEQLLAAHGIPCKVEKHSSAQSVSAFGTLPAHELACDISVPNEQYEQAAALLP